MAVDPNAVGAGTSELAFTTENTKDTPQRVLPTMDVVLGGSGVPFDKIASFNTEKILPMAADLHKKGSRAPVPVAQTVVFNPFVPFCPLIQPGKPDQNAFVDSCNGRFRDGCLHQQWFRSLEDARGIIDAWPDD